MHWQNHLLNSISGKKADATIVRKSEHYQKTSMASGPKIARGSKLQNDGKSRALAEINMYIWLKRKLRETNKQTDKGEQTNN